MKKLIIILNLLITAGVVSAQDSTKVSKGRIKKGFGVTVTQVQPEFPGGQDSLDSFLKENLQYPDSAKIKHISGRVYVGFLIDRNGKIQKPRILSSASPLLDEEALRVVNMMPDWKPGSAGGSPIDIQYVLPIDFIAPPAKTK